MALLTESAGRERMIPAAEIHHLLSNDRRRTVIRTLCRRAGTVSLRDLTETVAATESDTSPPPRAIRNSVYNSLAQTHLPKLHEMEVIEYDKHRKTVALGEHADRVRLYMEVVSPYGITWAQYYRTVALLALVTVVVLESGVMELPDGALVLTTTGFLVVIAASTVYQVWSRRWFFLDRLLD